ncbi:hypothetical protein [Streptomyces sp. NPDC050704]|uniref:hypothetical protein n=1 Tax=Streptomyces sp. NPDC050704 TaxID=3157219 RepID=UPI003443AF34
MFTRLHVPAGKAIAIASMPTALIMGMGFSTLAQADDKPSAKNNLTIDEYKDCVEALEGADEAEKDKGKDADASASPSPSASTSAPAADDDKEEPGSSGEKPAGDDSSDNGSSSDSGSDDKPEPTPSPSESKAPAEKTEPTPTPTPSPSESKNPLDPLGLGEAIKDIFTPDEKETATPTPAPSASAPAAEKPAEKPADKPEDTAKDPVGDTVDKVEDAAKGVTDKATEAAEDTKEKAEAAAEEAAASPTPSPSASSTTDPDDCPAATEDEGGVEQGIPALADDPWQLQASSLLLKGADYQGIVKVKTANGTVKEVLKYVISDGTDIGDLHQTVDDQDAGVKYHVQGAKGSTSTIRDGKTIMYTESISGNLLGLIPITFDPKHPPPLNIPLIYFTNVKVIQAAQFGGTLTIPGMRQYNTPLG